MKKKKKIIDVNPIDEIQLGAYSHCRLLHFYIFFPVIGVPASFPSYFFLSLLFARSFPEHSSSVKRNKTSPTRLDSHFISTSPNYRAAEENLSYITVWYVYFSFFWFSSFPSRVLPVIFFLRYIRCRSRSMFQQMPPVLTSLFLSPNPGISSAKSVRPM